MLAHPIEGDKIPEDREDPLLLLQEALQKAACRIRDPLSMRLANEGRRRVNEGREIWQWLLDEEGDFREVVRGLRRSYRSYGSDPANNLAYAYEDFGEEVGWRIAFLVLGPSGAQLENCRESPIVSPPRQLLEQFLVDLKVLKAGEGIDRLTRNDPQRGIDYNCHVNLARAHVPAIPGVDLLIGLRKGEIYCTVQALLSPDAARRAGIDVWRTK